MHVGCVAGRHGRTVSVDAQRIRPRRLFGHRAPLDDGLDLALELVDRAVRDGREEHAEGRAARSVGVRGAHELQDHAREALRLARARRAPHDRDAAVEHAAKGERLRGVEPQRLRRLRRRAAEAQLRARRRDGPRRSLVRALEQLCEVVRLVPALDVA